MVCMRASASSLRPILAMIGKLAVEEAGGRINQLLSYFQAMVHLQPTSAIVPWSALGLHTLITLIS